MCVPVWLIVLISSHWLPPHEGLLFPLYVYPRDYTSSLVWCYFRATHCLWGGAALKAKFRQLKTWGDKIVTWLAASSHWKIYLWLFLGRCAVNPPAQGWVHAAYLHSRTAAPLLLLWQRLQGVLIESALVKDNASGAGFVMGVVETLLSFWLH